MIKVKPQSYIESLRSYAEQWTPEQLREAIRDEKVIMARESLSDVAREHSQTILELYEEVLETKTVGKDFM
ncbi:MULTISPECIES: hypothetical protein [unclassified Marinobacterium]|uniref:hypothetical protein n=1 Tax=unclassified Marinobacterium TaxID=2644139 RepID=UPI001567F9C5|nr:MULTISPECIES: hypothetical protein [unclassified Marinobacterium]NRP11219.1 hypothetical protein [Marinobacterium sp. xm-g-48]NRP84082.1 hypothetical protein [Marinobacterium sp. xm-d-509]